MIRCAHGKHVEEGGQVNARIGYAAWVAGVVQFFVAHRIVEQSGGRRS